MTTKTRQKRQESWERECWGRTVGEGRLGQGQLGQDRRARQSVPLGQDSQDKTPGTIDPRQERQDSRERKIRHESPDNTAG
jgi:hypothetical protein